MKRNIGLVVLEISEGEAFDSIEQRLEAAANNVLPGRCLVILYSSNPTWGRSAPYDAIVTQIVVGPPGKREDRQFEFFANGVSRSYSGSKDKIYRDGGIHWLIMRRKGPKAYEKRHTATQDVIKHSELPTLHKVFTRDVANNVWHFMKSSVQRATIMRLGSLLAWSDETILILSESRSRRSSVKPLNLEGDLIGVANRTQYDIQHLLGLVLF